MTLDHLAHEVIRLRLATSQAATKKYAGLLLRQIDGRMNDTLQVWGAGRTGRWGGRSSLQPQNLKRPPRWLDPHTVADAVVGDYFPQVYGGMQSLEILGGSVRAVITATEGKTLVVSDLASIESRVVGWLSGCRWINDLFAHGKDSYKSFAELWMGVPYEQVTKEQRNQAKPPFLGFAYRLGGKGLVKYADSMGIDLTEAQCKEAITAARSACWEIPEMWATLEHVVQTVIRLRQPVTAYKCTWWIEGDFLTVQLPSRRKLYYHKPKWEQVKAPWGDMIWQMTYMGQSQFTNQWGRLQNHGGRFCLGGASLVLTDRGWIPLRNVQMFDRVWDGVEWVRHGGRVCNGVQDCVDLDGVLMTPTHEVLTDEGWKVASKNPRPLRAGLPPSYGPPTGRDQWEETPLVGPMRVRKGIRDGGRGLDQGGEELWVQNSRVHKRGELHPPYVYHAPVPDLAVHDGTMLPGEAPRFLILRRPRDFCAQAVARLHDLVGRLAGGILRRVDVGEVKHERQLRAGERGMGAHARSGQKPPKQPPVRRECSATVVRGKKIDPLLSVGARVVYDIVNAGPRKRYMVAGTEGPIIVHNCEQITQAIARDILAEGMRRYTNLGGSIVGHVHDEAIAEEDEADAKMWLDAMNGCLTRVPDWAGGLLLGSEGYISKRYKKG